MHFDWFDFAHHKCSQCKQNGFVQFIILGVVVLAIVAAGAFYLGRSTTPKPSPNPVATSQAIPSPNASISLAPTDSTETANWKTYTDSIRSFSFRYPSSWFFQECAGAVNASCVRFFLIGTEPDSESPGPGNEVFTIATYDEGKKSITDLKKERTCDVVGNPNSCVDFTLNGKSAFKVSSAYYLDSWDIYISLDQFNQKILFLSTRRQDPVFINKFLDFLRF